MNLLHLGAVYSLMLLPKPSRSLCSGLSPAAPRARCGAPGGAREVAALPRAVQSAPLSRKRASAEANVCSSPSLGPGKYFCLRSLQFLFALHSSVG